MSVARDIMLSNPPTTTPSMLVEALALRLLEEQFDGMCVLDEGQLVGVVTQMDLVFQVREPHMPAFSVFLDAVIPMPGAARLEREIRKISGASVADIMTREILHVTSDTPISTVAELMVDRHLTVVPVVDGGEFVGVIDKRAMLRAAYDLAKDATRR